MNLQGMSSPEVFAALFTLIWLLSRVLHLVYVQRMLPGKTFAAGIANVSLHTGMVLQMRG
jgi:hypothetical protein